eukprot:1473138-Rhodomonas_salina.1
MGSTSCIISSLTLTPSGREMPRMTPPLIRQQQPQPTLKQGQRSWPGTAHATPRGVCGACPSLSMS